jgi:hypothetical protein
MVDMFSLRSVGTSYFDMSFFSFPPSCAGTLQVFIGSQFCGFLPPGWELVWKSDRLDL